MAFSGKALHPGGLLPGLHSGLRVGISKSLFDAFHQNCSVSGAKEMKSHKKKNRRSVK